MTDNEIKNVLENSRNCLFTSALIRCIISSAVLESFSATREVNHA